MKKKTVKSKMPYVIVRSYVAGVHAGYLKKRDGIEVTLVKARRLYYWDGASTLSQLSVDGVARPQNCKFPCEVDSVEIISPQGLEILPCTEKARLSIAAVAVWKQ